MIDLRPPYPWEKQPEKPKEESPVVFIAVMVLMAIAMWLFSIVCNPLLG